MDDIKYRMAKLNVFDCVWKTSLGLHSRQYVPRAVFGVLEAQDHAGKTENEPVLRCKTFLKRM